MPLYGWVILVLVIVALVVLAGIVLQHRRRAGGVISARAHKKARGG